MQTRVIEDLNWRHATKAYIKGAKVEQEKIDAICEAIRLAPTSSGLQPFRIFVVSNQEIKDQLSSHVLNPQAMTNCSHFIVFAAWDEYTPERIDRVYDLITDKRNLSRGRFSRYTDMLKESFDKQTKEQHYNHASHQAYIALGYALAQAAELRVASTPAEGFDKEQVDRILKLDEKGLKSTLIMYLGVEDPEKDWLAPMAKVRIPMKELIVETID